MSKVVKYGSQMDAETWGQLKAYCEKTGKPIALVMRDAVHDYLAREQVRPEVQESAARVIARHDELLRRLAK